MESPMQPDMIDKIRGAIENLLERDPSKSFLIIEEIHTHKFVQFAGHPGRRLFFDLPSQILTDEEMEDARYVLAAFDVFYIQWKDSPHGSYSNYLDNVDEAVELTIQVITEVFRFDDDVQLKIIEN